MKSLYHRQFTMMLSLVLLSFLLLGGAFAGLSYQYITADKRESMESNANYIASFTGSYLGNLGTSIQDPVYQLYISTVANISGSTVILSENDGQVVFAASAREEDLGALLRGTIPADVVDTVTQQGIYDRPRCKIRVTAACRNENLCHFVTDLIVRRPLKCLPKRHI